MASYCLQKARIQDRPLQKKSRLTVPLRCDTGAAPKAINLIENTNKSRHFS